MARFVVAPQWQGSSSSRAMALIDGAEAIAGDLPRAACTRFEVPLEAGEDIGTGVHRASALLRIRRELSELLADIPAPAIAVGGDGGISLAAVDAAADDTTGIAWFSAHAAAHAPGTSATGAFAGMALRAVLGGFPGELALEPGRVAPERVVLAAARDVDPAEADWLDEAGVARVAAERIEESPAAVADALGDPPRVYVHIDLDALDPAELGGVSSPVPFGISVAALTGAIAALRARSELAGATIAGFAPSSPAAAVDDMGAILRIVSALTKDPS
ncbi:MAG: arginase family protein [Microbacterium sp.]